MLKTLSRDGRLYSALRSIRSRAVLLAKGLHDVDPSGYVDPRAVVARDLTAAEFTFVGRECLIGPGVSVGRYTMLAPRVAIVGGDHNWSQVGVPMQFDGRPAQQETVIGADVWIGQSAIILRGVSIGDGAVIAAGAVVTRPVPPCEVWAGVPARKLRDRFLTVADRHRHLEAIGGVLLEPRFAEPLSGRASQDDQDHAL